MRKFNFTSNADSSDYKAIDDWKIKRMETKDIVKFWLETTEMLRASTWSDMPRQASSKSYTIEDFKIRRMEITEALSHLEEIEFLWVLYNYGYGYSEREAILLMSKETEKPVNRTTIKRKEQAIVEKLYQEFWRRGLVSREEQIYFPSQSFIPYRGKRISRKSHGRELTV